MPQDPVPGLLIRATELLEQQFAALPAAGPAFESAADPSAMAKFWRVWRAGWATTTLISILFMRGRCSSRRILLHGLPMRWP